MNQKFQHLKLQKFASGNQQRIFKLTDKTVFVAHTLTETVANISKEYADRKYIYFGQYSTEKSIEFTSSNNKILTGDLINFHDVNSDYIANRGNKLSNFSNYIDQSINPWFNNELNQASSNVEKNKQQRVKYFPEYINTPIDITNGPNNSYFLLPISTEKLVSIIQPDKNYFLPEESYFNAALKENYEQTLKQFYKKPYYYAEDNTIPLYDMNFTFIQTVNLGSSEAVFKWLNDNGLTNKTYIENDKTYSISAQILFNSETNLVDTINPDSILLLKLLEIIENHMYLFGTNTEKNIIQDLIANLDNSSTMRMLLPIAQISKLNEQIISGSPNSFISSDILSKAFKNQNIMPNEEIIENFTKIQKYDWNAQEINYTLPQNILLSMDNRYSLLYPENKKNLPSGYYNIAYLKNNRDPHYDIHFKLPYSDTICDYTINKNIPNYISGGNINDNVSALNSIYDYDISKSIELTNEDIPGVATKNVVTNILNNAIKHDNSKLTDTEYIKKYPERMQAKVEHYLNSFKNRHITNNKLYNIGQLHGIRNYLNMKNINNSQNIWMSYKYNTNYDKNFQDTFNEVIQLPFANYNLNREQNWQYDNYGNKITDKVMKYADNLCPWYTQSDMKNFYSTNLTEIQKCVGCKLQKTQTCSGFCIFPYNKKLNMPKGYVWNRNKFFYQHPSQLNKINQIWNKQNEPYNNKINIDECFIIPSSEYDRELFAESDILVNDDIQLFITKNLIPTISELETGQNMNNISKHFKGIFQGFGEIPEYKILNQTAILNGQHVLNGYTIAENSPFNGPHIITSGTKFKFLNFDTDEITDTIPSGYTCLIRVRSWFSDSIKCQGKLLIKNNSIQTYIDNTLAHVSKYDFLECIKGFFNAQEKNMSKSNIYSIQLTNSGLNPSSDIKVKYYTKDEVIKELEKDNWLGIPLIYSYLYENKFYETKFTQDNIPFNYKLKNIPLSSILNDDTISNSVNGFKFNDMNIKTYSFDYVLSPPPELGYPQEWVITVIDGEIRYINKKQQKKAQEINIFRKQLRALLEENIKKIINRNMPAHTILWQILYSGK